ncbi:hypothetical protein Naga_100052g7 [Nannochloropsis gaditana]|uniref:Uncharacterized protein n=1 Tax=Nannochloropsis gaditana TaxID=72520 RepID=W7T686_9STRA|nr:hypothetical protein Naga_100052g7 [Nannochloropsis gaditana]
MIVEMQLQPESGNMCTYLSYLITNAQLVMTESIGYSAEVLLKPSGVLVRDHRALSPETLLFFILLLTSLPSASEFSPPSPPLVASFSIRKPSQRITITSICSKLTPAFFEACKSLVAFPYDDGSICRLHLISTFGSTEKNATSTTMCVTVGWGQKSQPAVVLRAQLDRLLPVVRSLGGAAFENLKQTRAWEDA